jgi:2-polyprenyl-3-methyl-5-hydroxy-6-metoxy-1,4-benzoquinol methylase
MIRNWRTTLGALIGAASPAKWDREYACGAWGRLFDEGELVRYEEIVRFVMAHGDGPSVLDVGCGSGRLFGLLRSARISRYVGVDLSAEALAQIDRAGAENLASFRLEAHDAGTWEPQAGERFDVIVLNEVLYYMKEPARILARYARMLEPEGVLVVSLLDSLAIRSLWRKIEADFETVERVRAANRRGGPPSKFLLRLFQSWDVRKLRPRTSA